MINEKSNFLPVTDKRMTRFFLTLKDSVKFVVKSFSLMNKGEVFVPKMYSLKIEDLALSLKPGIKIKIIGLRPGEKIDELLCSNEENQNTLEFKDHYTIFRNNEEALKYNKLLKGQRRGKKVSKSFYYSSLNNSRLLKIKDIVKIFPNLI